MIVFSIEVMYVKCFLMFLKSSDIWIYVVSVSKFILLYGEWYEFKNVEG